MISHTIDSLRGLVDKIIVVTGRYDQELRPYLNDVEVVYNKNFELGMFSSVLAGVKHADGDVLILPGDMMNIAHTTVKAVLDKNGCIVIPAYNGKSGHPLFLNNEMRNLLVKEDVNSNLREFVNKHIDKVSYVEVNDPFINFDVDTIQDYEHLLKARKEMSYEG